MIWLAAAAHSLRDNWGEVGVERGEGSAIPQPFEAEDRPGSAPSLRRTLGHLAQRAAVPGAGDLNGTSRSSWVLERGARHGRNGGTHLPLLLPLQPGCTASGLPFLSGAHRRSQSAGAILVLTLSCAPLDFHPADPAPYFPSLSHTHRDTLPLAARRKLSLGPRR